MLVFNPLFLSNKGLDLGFSFTVLFSQFYTTCKFDGYVPHVFIQGIDESIE